MYDAERGEQMSCTICESEFVFHDRVTIDGVEVPVCPTCHKRFHERHTVVGRYYLEQCPTCHHIKGVVFKGYKKKGRPAGSKNISKLGGKDKKVPALETFTEHHSRGIS